MLQGWGLDPRRLTLALLPGSRGSEIARHLPTMLAAAQLIRQAIPEVQFLLPLASTAPRELVEGMVAEFLGGRARERGSLPSPQTPLPTLYRGLGRRSCAERERGACSPSAPPPKHLPASPRGQAYAALKAAHLAVVASGTVTVEAALAATPTVIIYRLAPLTYEVARRLIRVDHIGMANLLAGAGLFPELIQDRFYG